VIDDPLPHPYLREWREARGMTQHGLANAAGLTFSDIARYETSESGMRMEVLFALMHALDLTPWYFFTHPDEPNGWTSCPPLPLTA
jgi:transcriptional regulator with XRE-family HTH domain